MRIGLLEPSILMSNKLQDRIFAPKELFIYLADGLVKRGHEVFAYAASGLNTQAHVIEGNKLLENNEFPSVRDVVREAHVLSYLTTMRNHSEYEIELISKAFLHAKQNDLQILHSQSNVFTHYFVKFVDLPVLFTLHDPVFPKNTLEFFVLNMFSDHNYIAISERQKKNYQNLLHFPSVYMIHHGLDISKTKFYEKSEDYLSLMGRILPQKGFEDAIHIAIKLNKKLKMATSKNYIETEYFNTRIKPLLHSPNIEQMLYLQGKQKNEFLGLAKAFLFPIKWEEPFGMVMIEAMATGTPVVAYAQGSVPEIVKDGGTGFMVNLSEQDKRGDWIIKKTGIEGLYEAIERIYAMSQEQYQQMRKNCRAHVEKHFTVEKMVNYYEKVYQEIIDKQ